MAVGGPAVLSPPGSPPAVRPAGSRGDAPVAGRTGGGPVTRTLTAGPDHPDDDRTGPDRVSVDPPAERRTIFATVTATTEHDRRPVVPAALRNADERRDLARWAVRFGAHVTAFHLVRLPWYLIQLAFWSPRGAYRVARVVTDAVRDSEAGPLRRTEVERRDSAAYLKLVRERNRRVTRRGGIAVGALGVIVALGWTVLGPVPALVPGPDGALVPGPGPTLGLVALRTLTVGLVVGVLGMVGAPRDRRIAPPATIAPSAPPRLSADVVTRALQSLGIAAMGPKAAAPAFVAPITRDGPGWRADVDLPHGVTVADVMERRDRLASGLRRPLSAVWPEASAEQHAGRLVLWVGDQPLNKVKPAVWPLAKRGDVQVIGARFPFGTDQRQRPVLVTLEETNALIGALPGGGKTAAVRVLGLAAALDVHCELRIGEHKGSGDLEALEQVAHRYASGVDDEALGVTLASLRQLLDEVADRAARVKRLPRQLVPDRKVTPELAARPGSGLHPIVQIIDEAQELFTHPEIGKEAGELAERIIKRGRAFGVYLVIATQRPDAKSVPSGVSGNVGLRFCLRVTGQVENDMILGTSAYKNGIRATTLSPSDRGIGYLVGAGDDPLVVRTYYIDAPTAQAVAERARAARVAAGLLAGQAAGEKPRTTALVDLLEDLATIYAVAEVRRMWSEEIVARLAELRPDTYGGWTPDSLAKALPAGLETRQINARDAAGHARNRKGLDLDDVQNALGQRRLGGAG